MKERKLICFVAMAIGQDETDDLYRKTIKPILKSLEIVARRVDQIQSNRDIDEIIFDEIDKADFVISDLTFARPSVYYEAGYARGRGRRVVYTCRRDHFRSRPDDEHGNFRIHFDVLMKNTVSWESSVDPQFEKRLRIRLIRVITPLRVKMRREAEKADEVEAYSTLPFKEKTRSIIEEFKEFLKEGGMNSIEIGSQQFSEYQGLAFLHAPNSALNWYRLLDPGCFGSKVAQAGLIVNYLVVVPYVGKRLVHLLAEMMQQPLADLLPLTHTSSPLSSLSETVFICSLKKCSFSTNEAVMPHYSITNKGCKATWKYEYWAPRGNFRAVKHLFANLDYERKFVGISSGDKEKPVFYVVDREGKISFESRGVGAVAAITRSVTLLLIHSIRSAKEVRKVMAGVQTSH